MLVNGKQVQDPNSDGSETGLPPGWKVLPNGTFAPKTPAEKEAEAAAVPQTPYVPPTPTVSDQSNPTPAAPAPAAPAPAAPAATPPTPMAGGGAMASLQAAADPGAGWDNSTAKSALRPGLGARTPLPMQRLFPSNPY